MRRQRSFSAVYGSPLRGALGVAGFFSLIVVFVPIQIAYTLFRPKDIFRFPKLFYRLLLRILKFKLRVSGAAAATAPVLFVSNHSSYLDVPVLASLLDAAFVAKAEVRQWPLIGYLAYLQNTLFIERRSVRAESQRVFLHDKLANGRSLILFPEGTSSDGLSVLPFKSSLFSIVGDAPTNFPMTVQPVSVTCTALDGLPVMRAWRPYYSWYGDMTFVPHLWNVFKMGHFTVDVVFHAPVSAADFPNRKLLAAYCQEQVARGIELSLTGRRLKDTGEMPIKLAAPAAPA